MWGFPGGALAPAKLRSLEELAEAPAHGLPEDAAHAGHALARLKASSGR